VSKEEKGMITFNVRYRPPGRLFFRSIKDAIADGLLPELPGMRYIIRRDGTRVDLPAQTEVIFSAARAELVKQIEAANKKNTEEGNSSVVY